MLLEGRSSAVPAVHRAVAEGRGNAYNRAIGRAERTQRCHPRSGREDNGRRRPDRVDDVSPAWSHRRGGSYLTRL